MTWKFLFFRGESIRLTSTKTENGGVLIRTDRRFKSLLRRGAPPPFTIRSMGPIVVVWKVLTEAKSRLRMFKSFLDTLWFQVGH